MAGAGGAAGEASSGGQSMLGQAGETAGGSGSEPGYPPLVDGCVDLDENEVGDCQETLAKNPGFMADTQSWTPDLSAVLSWDAKNAFGAEASGSAKIASSGASDQDGFSLAASSQCLAVSGEAVDVRANYFIASGQGEGLATLGVFFFDVADCGGEIRGPLAVSQAKTATWGTLATYAGIPVGAVSMRVRLAVSKPYRSESFEVLFDNVLVRSR